VKIETTNDVYDEFTTGNNSPAVGNISQRFLLVNEYFAGRENYIAKPMYSGTHINVRGKHSTNDGVD